MIQTNSLFDKINFNGGNPSHKEFVKNEMDFLISSLASIS